MTVSRPPGNANGTTDGTGRELATPTRVFGFPRSIHSFDDDWTERPTNKTLTFGSDAADAAGDDNDNDSSADSTREMRPVVELSSTDLVSEPDLFTLAAPHVDRRAADPSLMGTSPRVEVPRPRPASRPPSVPPVSVSIPRPTPKLIFSAALQGPAEADDFYPTAWPAIDPSKLDDRLDDLEGASPSCTITPPAPDAADAAALASVSLDPFPPSGNVPTSRAPGSQPTTGRPAASEWAGAPSQASMRPRRSRLFVPAVVGSLVVAAAAWGAVFGLHRGEAKSCAVREPRIALEQRTPLAAGVAGALPKPPSQGCAALGSRVLARRAQIGAGLDVTPFDTGFGIGLAGGAMEAVGLRVDGTGLRVAETLRVKAPILVSHVATLAGRDEEADSLDVRVDQGDTRTVVVSETGKAVRVIAQDGAISALWDDHDARGPHARYLWSVPTVKPAPPKSGPTKPMTEVVRAVGRDDGGAVLALRRPTGLWLGMIDATFAPAGPLVALSRKGSIGTPAVSSWGGGGAVAWAERPQGERDWTIMVATFSPDGQGATTAGSPRPIAKGMSPAIAELPDGDLLLAYADGGAGAHRVVTARLDHDLSPRGEPVVVSPAAINAGQPALAVRPDGRALVAFFSADKGRPSTAPVLATPLMCDSGL